MAVYRVVKNVVQSLSNTRHTLFESCNAVRVWPNLKQKILSKIKLILMEKPNPVLFSQTIS